MIRWAWQRKVRPKDPERTVNPRRAELETAKEILADLFGLVLYEELIHQLKSVPDGLGPCVIVKVHPDLSGLQLSLLDTRYPWVKLLLLVEIILCRMKDTYLIA